MFECVNCSINLFTDKPLYFAKELFAKIRGVTFADSGEMNDIDLLIGSDFYWELATGNVKKGKQDGLVALDTEFGYTFSVPITCFILYVRLY